METWKDFFKRIYNKICYGVCKVLKITPCLCKHECGCKKENNK